MRYVFILLIIFSLANKTIASPARAGLLEIRSIPVVRSKPIVSLWTRFAKKLVEGDIMLKSFGSAFAMVLPPFLGAALIQPLAAVPIMFFSFPAVILAIDAAYQHEDPVRKLVWKHIYYVQQHEGTATLCRGCIIRGTPYGESGVIVETTDGQKSRISIDDIRGVAVPDHPDLRRRVSLLTNTDDIDHLRVIGKVSRAYDDRSYEIEIDRKVDYHNVESHVDESITIFVHASLPEDEGGFVFIDSKASEHNEAIQLIEAEHQADYTEVQVEQKQSVVISRN